MTTFKVISCCLLITLHFSSLYQSDLKTVSQSRQGANTEAPPSQTQRNVSGAGHSAAVSVGFVENGTSTGLSFYVF